MQDVVSQLSEVATTTAQTFDLKKVIQSNAFAQGGLIIGAAGFLIAFCRSLPGRIYKSIRKVLVLTVEIESQGSSFYKNRILRNITKYKKNLFNQNMETDFQYNDQDDSYKTEFRLGIGAFYAKEKFWMKIDRQRQTDKMNLNEFIFIEAFIWNKKRLIDLIDRCMNEAEKKNNVYVSEGGDWSQKNVFRGRTWDDIVLQEGVKEKIVNDINQFVEDRKWYTSRNAVHHRGYCFWGSPGTGKTSISAAIATTMGKSLYILHLTKLLTDQNLADLMSSADGVVLVEDIDGILDGRKILVQDACWSFSGLLNAINGANPDMKSRVIIMTSNHPEKLDPALLRPGRIDQIIQIDGIGADKAVELFRIFHGENLEIESQIKVIVGDAIVQPVILREAFISQKRDISKIPEELKRVMSQGILIEDLPSIVPVELSDNWDRSNDFKDDEEEDAKLIEEGSRLRAQHKELREGRSPSKAAKASKEYMEEYHSLDAQHKD